MPSPPHHHHETNDSTRTNAQGQGGRVLPFVWEGGRAGRGVGGVYGRGYIRVLGSVDSPRAKNDLGTSNVNSSRAVRCGSPPGGSKYQRWNWNDHDGRIGSTSSTTHKWTAPDSGRRAKSGQPQAKPRRCTPRALWRSSAREPQQELPVRSQQYRVVNGATTRATRLHVHTHTHTTTNTHTHTHTHTHAHAHTHAHTHDHLNLPNMY